jgi:hypothetical protein
MPIKLKNNATGILATSISASDTGLVLQAGNGAAFSALGAGEYFYATLASAGGTLEIVKVTARVGDTMTVLRAQEGTSAAGFAAGSRLEQRVTAQSVIDAVGDVVASQVGFTPTGGIAATDVQAALAEVDSEKIAFTRLDDSDGSSLVGFIQAGSDAVVRTAQSKMRDVVSVKDFGAVGDGVADDTAAIQAAVDAANNVFVPSGNYRLASSVVLKTNTTIQGAGRRDASVWDGGTRFAPNAGVQSFVTAGVANPLVGASNITLSDFSINNNFTGSLYDIELANAHSCTVSNVFIGSGNTNVADCAGIYFSFKVGYVGSVFVNTVKNCRLSAASVKFESTDNYLLDSEIWGNNRSFAVHVVRSSINIDSCQIVGGSVYGGLYVHDTRDSFNVELVKVSNTFFDGSYQSVDSDIGINAVQMIRSSIVGNGFWRQTKEGIKIVSGQTVTIGNNVFIDNNRSDTSKNDIDFDNCQACVTTGNIFQRTVNHANKGKAISTVNSPNAKNTFYNNTAFFVSNYIASTFSNLDLSADSEGITLAGKTNVQANVTTDFAGVVGAETLLTFGTEVTDPLNEFDGTNFVAKSPGFYTISYTISYTSIFSGTRIVSRVLLNNATYATIYDKVLSVNGNTTDSGSITLLLNTNDKINVNYFQDAVGDIVAGGARTRLNIMRVD